MNQGTTLSFNRRRGFGFILPDDGGNNLFVHVSQLPRNHEYLNEGSIVTYDIQVQPDGRLRAKNVQIVSEPQRNAAVQQ